MYISTPFPLSNVYPLGKSILNWLIEHVVQGVFNIKTKTL